MGFKHKYNRDWITSVFKQKDKLCNPWNNLAIDHLYRVQENDKAVLGHINFYENTEEITAKKGQVTLDQPLELDMRQKSPRLGLFQHPPALYELMVFVMFKFSSLQPQLELLLSGNV